MKKKIYFLLGNLVTGTLFANEIFNLTYSNFSNNDVTITNNSSNYNWAEPEDFLCKKNSQQTNCSNFDLSSGNSSDTFLFYNYLGPFAWMNTTNEKIAFDITDKNGTARKYDVVDPSAPMRPFLIADKDFSGQETGADDFGLSNPFHSEENFNDGCSRGGEEFNMQLIIIDNIDGQSSNSNELCYYALLQNQPLIDFNSYKQSNPTNNNLCPTINSGNYSTSGYLIDSIHSS